jgi:hypothetical protein
MVADLRHEVRSETGAKLLDPGGVEFTNCKRPAVWATVIALTITLLLVEGCGTPKDSGSPTSSAPTQAPNKQKAACVQQENGSWICK